MNVLLILLMLIQLILLQTCSRPKATVFEDNRLAQEEIVKFCLIGDIGKDTPHQKAMAEALEREQCHRIFFLGDLVYQKGIKSADDPELEEKFMKYYRPLVEGDPNLVIGLVLGNHDHQGEPSAWKKVSEENPQFFFPNYYYLVDYGGLCIVALDTSFYYYTRFIAEAGEQTQWLISMNSRLKECDVKVAITHHPLRGGNYSGSKDWKGAPQPLKGFLDTYIVGRMDMHVAGHVHILENDGKKDDTHLLISGTGGEILGDGKSGFVILTWEPMNPKRIGYALRTVDVSVNVFEDTAERQEDSYSEDGEEDHIIHKDRVERPWWKRLFKD